MRNFALDTLRLNVHPSGTCCCIVGVWAGKSPGLGGAGLDLAGVSKVLLAQVIWTEDLED